jgi:hypothetical protein
MCNICDDFKNKKIDSKKAFERITKALKDQSDDEKTGHLIELSAKILDSDVPMPESNEELDKKWHDENN